MTIAKVMINVSICLEVLIEVLINVIMRSKGGFTILTQGLALRCVKFAISENIMFFVKIF